MDAGSQFRVRGVTSHVPAPFGPDLSGWKGVPFAFASRNAAWAPGCFGALLQRVLEPQTRVKD